MKLADVFAYTEFKGDVLFFSKKASFLGIIENQNRIVKELCKIPKENIINLFQIQDTVYLVSDNALLEYDVVHCKAIQKVEVNYMLLASKFEESLLAIEEKSNGNNILLLQNKRLTRVLIVENKKVKPVILFNSIIVLHDPSNVYAVDVTSNIKIWELDVKNSYKFDDSGVITEGNIFQISGSTTSIILSVVGFHLINLSARTGAIIWQQKFLRPIVKFEIDEPAGKIYVYNKITHFYVLDLNTGEILFTKEIRNSWRNQGFDPWLSGFTVDTDFIYATGSDIKKIAVIDKETLDILKTIDIDTSEKIPDGYKPHIIGECIYQLDGDSTLHIFDKRTMAYLSK